MDNKYSLRELVKEGVVVVCRSVEQIEKLSELVEQIKPGYGKYVREYCEDFGFDDLMDALAVRLEEHPFGKFYWGYDSPGYYEDLGYTIVDFYDLDGGEVDYGEFEKSESNILDFFVSHSLTGV